MLARHLHDAENRAPLLRHADAAFGAKRLQSSRYFSLRKWQWNAPVVATGRIYAATKSWFNAGQLDCQSRIIVEVIPRCDSVATKRCPFSRLDLGRYSYSHLGPTAGAGSPFSRWVFFPSTPRTTISSPIHTNWKIRAPWRFPPRTSPAPPKAATRS